MQTLPTAGAVAAAKTSINVVITGRPAFNITSVYQKPFQNPTFIIRFNVQPQTGRHFDMHVTVIK